MEKTVKVLLYDSLAGTNFAYGKGENDIPESLAKRLVADGLGEYVGAPKTAAKPSDLAETRPSTAAKKAEKR